VNLGRRPTDRNRWQQNMAWPHLPAPEKHGRSSRVLTRHRETSRVSQPDSPREPTSSETEPTHQLPDVFPNPPAAAAETQARGDATRLHNSRFRKDFKLKTEHRSGGVGGRQRHKRESDKSERAVGSRRLSRPPPPRSGAPHPRVAPRFARLGGSCAPRHQIGRKTEVIFVAAVG